MDNDNDGDDLVQLSNSSSSPLNFPSETSISSARKNLFCKKKQKNILCKKKNKSLLREKNLLCKKKYKRKKYLL